jgi:hypothetical protein
LLTDNEFTKILGWPGYRVYHHEIDEKGQDPKTLGATQARQPGTEVSAAFMLD